MRNAIVAGTVTITGAGGNEIEAYAALPQVEATLVDAAQVDPSQAEVGRSSSATAGVVVIHHMPGFDWATKEIVRRLAVWGYAAVCPNLHFRDAPGADSDDAAAANRAAGGVPDERLVGDVAGARDYLLGQPTSNGRTGVIGFCSGGRQSVLAACELPFDAAVDCYGAFVLRSPAADSGMRIGALTDRLPSLRAPLLGLFGNDDSFPSPAEVDEFDELLTARDHPHEFHRFDGAGHAFFNVTKPSYRPEIAVRAWELVREFYARELGSPAF